LAEARRNKEGGNIMLKKVIFRFCNIMARLYLTPILAREWKIPLFASINERPIEYGFVFNQLTSLCPAEVLDVGTGTSALPHLMANCGFRVTAIDKVEGYWSKGYWSNRSFNRHYYVIKDDIANPRINKQFDLITCISVLEHIPDHKGAIRGMFGLLRSGGHLTLTFPYNETTYKANAYDLPESSYGQNAPYICQIFSRAEINRWMEDTPCEILQQEYYDCFYGPYWSCGERKLPPIKTTASERHHLTLLLMQKR
jgi:2-polyprenyl-3-methyl-5-hydroxy-6-metoxy-1,4-benzoquinol methylase